MQTTFFICRVESVIRRRGDGFQIFLGDRWHDYEPAGGEELEISVDATTAEQLCERIRRIRADSV